MDTQNSSITVQGHFGGDKVTNIHGIHPGGNTIRRTSPSTSVTQNSTITIKGYYSGDSVTNISDLHPGTNTITNLMQLQGIQETNLWNNINLGASAPKAIMPIASLIKL